MKPLFNEMAAQRATRHRRFQLAPQAQLHCSRLDAQMPDLERAEQGAPGGPGRAAAQHRLFDARQQYRTLGC